MVIMAVISTMLVMSWMSLSRAYAFTSADNKARATVRDASTRITSEIRAAQPASTSSHTPFYVPGTAPYWNGGTAGYCDGYDCTFYSAYNNSLAYSKSGSTGLGANPNQALQLTAIWLDTSGTQPQKTLYWQRDTNGNGALDSGDRKIALAGDVINKYLSTPIFTYNLYDVATNKYSTAATLTSGNVANVTSVQIDVIADANISHTPHYIELMTTVQPRNEGTN